MELSYGRKETAARKVLRAADLRGGDIILKAQGIPIMERAGAVVLGPTASQELEVKVLMWRDRRKQDLTMNVP